MRSLAVRDFSIFRSRMLSAIHVTRKKTREFQRLSTEENLSEPRPSNKQQEQHPSEEYEVANRELVDNHFDEEYLQSRSDLLAYGKQMKRVDGTRAESPPPPNARSRKIESRSSKLFRRNTSKNSKSLRQVRSSWLSRIRRSPSRNSAGSMSQKHLQSPRG